MRQLLWHADIASTYMYCRRFDVCYALVLLHDHSLAWMPAALHKPHSAAANTHLL